MQQRTRRPSVPVARHRGDTAALSAVRAAVPAGSMPPAVNSAAHHACAGRASSSRPLRPVRVVLPPSSRTASPAPRSARSHTRLQRLTDPCTGSSVHCSGSLPAAPLQAGTVVTLENQSFDVTHLLGSGSFGCTWAAICRESGEEVAIKELICTSQQQLTEAETESALLRLAGGSRLRAKLRGEARIPMFLAAQTESGAGAWHVRLAMSRMRGEAGDVFLERQMATLESLPPLQEGSMEQQQALVRASDTARWMVSQMAEVFADMSLRLVHRDAHLRNMLVNVSESRASFSLVDFGLAVDIPHWQKGGWRQKTIAGDCRYWPPSSWLLFEKGAHELCSRSRLLTEYEHHLDFHSIGLSAMQLFLALAQNAIEGGHPLLKKLRQLKAVWCHFWSDATHYWQGVMKAFRGEQDLRELQEHYRAVAVDEITQRNLLALKLALHEVFVECRGPSTLAQTLSALFECLACMICCSEDMSRPPSWHAVQKLVNIDASTEMRYQVPKRRCQSAAPRESGANAARKERGFEQMPPLSARGASQTPHVPQPHAPRTEERRLSEERSCSKLHSAATAASDACKTPRPTPTPLEASCTGTSSMQSTMAPSSRRGDSPPSSSEDGAAERAYRRPWQLDLLAAAAAGGKAPVRTMQRCASASSTTQRTPKSSTAGSSRRIVSTDTARPQSRQLGNQVLGRRLTTELRMQDKELKLPAFANPEPIVQQVVAAIEARRASLEMETAAAAAAADGGHTCAAASAASAAEGHMDTAGAMGAGTAVVRDSNGPGEQQDDECGGIRTSVTRLPMPPAALQLPGCLTVEERLIPAIAGLHEDPSSKMMCRLVTARGQSSFLARAMAGAPRRRVAILADRLG
eukprot:TRINITY_DN18441_c0_g1_i2.p1 TRINITY_DN18441_c0_g1~~TRINITY_DN18441_c0_g1_i2.p1  ORF type:complete len:861 (-),score=155.48 TRINITY_DN18441_c0_g1_i2:243-2825(-)